MRLAELDPRWLVRDGRRIGFTFLCPCCRKDRLTVVSEPTPFRQQLMVMHAAMGTKPEGDDDWPVSWVPAKVDFGWALSNTDDFNAMTVTPSIDASRSGNWHGFIKNGEIC